MHQSEGNVVPLLEIEAACNHVQELLQQLSDITTDQDVCKYD